MCIVRRKNKGNHNCFEMTNISPKRGHHRISALRTFHRDYAETIFRFGLVLLESRPKLPTILETVCFYNDSSFMKLVLMMIRGNYSRYKTISIPLG